MSRLPVDRPLLAAVGASLLSLLHLLQPMAQPPPAPSPAPLPDILPPQSVVPLPAPLPPPPLLPLPWQMCPADPPPSAPSPRPDAAACPEGVGPAGLGLAIWVVGDDRDNPAMRKQMAEAIALRMRCLAAARSLLLHAGDSFTHHRWSLAGRGGELEQIAEDWQPLRSIPGIGYYLAAGNHEGVEGVRLLAARLGPASISADPPEQPYLARNEGGLRIIVVNTEDHRLLLGGRGPQAVWLHQQIGQARQEQSLPVLLMHRPPQRLSCGIHRHDRDLAAWDRVLAQLLDDGPGLLLAAHDHLYARARLSGHWLGVLVGNGGAPLDDERGRDPTRRCSPSLPGFHGFLECQSLAEALYCTEIALPGGIVDSFSILRSLPLAAPFEAR